MTHWQVKHLRSSASARQQLRGAHFGKPPSTASMLGTTSPNCLRRSWLRHSASDTAIRSSSASASSVSALRKVPCPAARPLACPDASSQRSVWLSMATRCWSAVRSSGDMGRAQGSRLLTQDRSCNTRSPGKPWLVGGTPLVLCSRGLPPALCSRGGCIGAAQTAR